jgi:RNA polymerase sigma-B factor
MLRARAPTAQPKRRAANPSPNRSAESTRTSLPDAGIQAASEASLLRRYKEEGDPRVREELVNRLTPLARSLALRYRGPGEPVEDLFQVATVGLLKAIDRFDHTRGTAFSSFAIPTILGELRRHFRDHTWKVSVPRNLQERVLAVRDAISVCSGRIGRRPTPGELSDHLGVPEEEVLEAIQADQLTRTVSLDQPPATDDGGDSPPHVETLGTEELGYQSVDAQLAVEDSGLEEDEYRVLRIRYGEGLTQQETGNRLGVSQMQVSRLQRRALSKLLRSVRGEVAIAR